MSDPAAAAQADGAAPSPALLWLGAWLIATAALAWQLATAWPYEGHWAQLLMLFTLAGVAFRTVQWLHERGGGARLAGRKRLGVRVLAIVVALLAAGAAWQALARLSMARFERAMAPLVAQMHANASSPCPAPGKYPLHPQGLPGSLAWDTQRFIFWTRGGSMDIDGSTVWYDSTTRRWSKFHNDNRRARGEFERLQAPLRECGRTAP